MARAGRRVARRGQGRPGRGAHEVAGPPGDTAAGGLAVQSEVAEADTPGATTSFEQSGPTLRVRLQVPESQTVHWRVGFRRGAVRVEKSEPVGQLQAELAARPPLPASAREWRAGAAATAPQGQGDSVAQTGSDHAFAATAILSDGFPATVLIRPPGRR